MNRRNGFTLIELMIALLIVGILTSIAIPSYRIYVQKGNRRAAQAVMMDIANVERQYFVANRAFGAVADLGYALPNEVSSNYTYDITVSAGPPPSFTITFSPQGSMAGDSTLTLDSAGNKTPADKW